MDKIPSAVLTRNEVAALLAVHPQTVTEWAERGELPFFWLPGRRTRRFKRADVEAVLNGNLPAAVAS